MPLVGPSLKYRIFNVFLNAYPVGAAEFGNNPFSDVGNPAKNFTEYLTILLGEGGYLVAPGVEFRLNTCHLAFMHEFSFKKRLTAAGGGESVPSS
ncbi:hypothetical protein [Thiosocius teredinicola]|uniref:hypothetical protein n=1 Tax=Thiosocius teredinicola TaxID=1973002 RepID=UPI000990CCA5